MTNQKLFDALEICLQAIDHGADVEACLRLFPALADDLRPMLMTAVQVRSGAVADVPEDAARRGKARVLQAAAEMREQADAAPVALVLRWWSKRWNGTRLARLAVTSVAMLAFLLTGGTGLVSASSSALPGDHLYPVKRSWEDVQLFFVSNPTAKQHLEQEFEQERFQEIEGLYTAKRVAQVNFQGQVETRANGEWVVGGLSVSLNGNSTPDPGIVNGVTVQVIGEADNGVIKAEQVLLVTTPTPFLIPVVIPSIQTGSTPVPTETELHGLLEEEGTPTSTQSSEMPAYYPTATRRPYSGGSDSNSTNSTNNDNNTSDDGGDH